MVWNVICNESQTGKFSISLKIAPYLMSGKCHFHRTGRRMTNLVSNFEYLFWFFFSRNQNQIWKNSNSLKIISFELRHPWRCPKFQNLAVVKKHNNNKYSKFHTKFVIWHPVKMTWSGHKYAMVQNNRKATLITFWNISASIWTIRVFKYLSK